MARKTFNEKLNYSKDMPKIIKVTGEKSIKRYDGEDMLIAPPLEYNEIMAKIPKGKLITTGQIREFFSKETWCRIYLSVDSRYFHFFSCSCK